MGLHIGLTNNTKKGPCETMLRKNRDSFSGGVRQAIRESNAGLPMKSDYVPSNVYKTLDCTDPFRNMAPNNIPVPGTSVWTNPNVGSKPLSSAYDMVGMISSFDRHQRNTINPLELLSTQNEGSSVLHPEVQPLYEGCRRLILNGHMDVGYCQYQDKIINFGKLFLDKETYLFPYPFRGYNKNEISVFLVKYRSPNIILQFEPVKEFNDELFGIGTHCKSSAVVMNYFWIAWAYKKNKDQQIFDFIQ